MASAKQAAANRSNALKSTGPKNTQNVRFNALRHGLRAQTVVLPDEDPAEFNRLLQDLETEWQPQTPTEFIQVERMAVNYWKLARADRREAFYRLNDMPDRFVDQSFKFQQGFERAFDRAQQALERLQTNRSIVVAEDSVAAPPEPPAVGAIEIEPVPEPPHPPAESSPPPQLPAHVRRYFRKQSAENEKRERALMRAGYYRRADRYPLKVKLKIRKSATAADPPV